MYTRIKPICNHYLSTINHHPPQVPLSPQGHEQARELGRRLKGIIGNEPLYIYTSPYLRTKQTLAGLLESFEENLKVGIREEPRITEQQVGVCVHRLGSWCCLRRFGSW